ncbi:hypothetical protein B0A53_00882 [Rhodotorula sp. CCFEE 5036]|nr:hypothetical protein B0A53_00882 [Rhodotorula sp. CCFEE 5036]
MSAQQATPQGLEHCIKGAPGARFSRGEEACLSNCVDRFLDSSLFIVKSLEERKGHM